MSNFNSYRFAVRHNPLNFLTFSLQLTLTTQRQESSKSGRSAALARQFSGKGLFREAEQIIVL
jgi:hypothetical protein